MADFSMADQSKGLPMGDLIGGPLQAACDAQVRLALSTAQFIQQIGFLPPPANTDGTAGAAPSATRTVQFKFDRPKAQQPVDANGAPLPDTAMETVELTVPLLAIVKVPALSITTVDMEVKNTDRSETSEDKKGSFAADAR